MSNNLNYKRNLNETKKKPTEKLKQSTTDKDIVMYEFTEDPSFTSGEVNKEVDIIHIEDSFSYIKDDSKHKADTPKPTTSFSKHGEEEEIVVSEGCRPKEELMQLLEDESFLEAHHENKHLVYENKTDRETYINLDDPAIYSHRQGKKNTVQMKFEGQYKIKSAKYQNLQESKEKWIANITPLSKAKRDIAILLGHNNTRHQEYLNVCDFGELRDYFDSETINCARQTKISRHKKNQKSKELYTKFKDEIETEFYETYGFSNADDHGYGTRDTFGTGKKQFCEIGVNTEETMTTPRNMLCQNCFASIKDNKINYTMNTHLTTKLKQLEDEINIWKNHNQTYQFDEINKNLRDTELVNADRLDEVNYMLETFRTKQTHYDHEKLRSTIRSELDDTNKDVVRYKETETSKPTRLNYKNIPEADDSKDYSHNISKILRTSRNHYKSNRNSPIRTPKDYSSLSIIEAKIIDKKEVVRNKINEIVKRLKALKSDYDTDTIFDEEDIKYRYSKIQSNIITTKTYEEESNYEVNRDNDNVLQGTSLTFKKDVRKSLALCLNNDYRFTVGPVLKNKKEYEIRNNIQFNIKQKKADIRKLMKESFERDISTDHFSLTIGSIQNNIDSKFNKNTKTLQITNKKIIESDSEVEVVDTSLLFSGKKKSEKKLFNQISKNEPGCFSITHKIKKGSTNTFKILNSDLNINKPGSFTILKENKKPYEVSHDINLTIDCTTAEETDSAAPKKIKKVIKRLVKKKTEIDTNTSTTFSQNSEICQNNSACYSVHGLSKDESTDTQSNTINITNNYIKNISQIELTKLILEKFVENLSTDSFDFHIDRQPEEQKKKKVVKIIKKKVTSIDDKTIEENNMIKSIELNTGSSLNVVTKESKTTIIDDIATEDKIIKTSQLNSGSNLNVLNKETKIYQEDRINDLTILGRTGFNKPLKIASIEDSSFTVVERNFTKNITISSIKDNRFTVTGLVISKSKPITSKPLATKSSKKIPGFEVLSDEDIDDPKKKQLQPLHRNTFDSDSLTPQVSSLFDLICSKDLGETLSNTSATKIKKIIKVIKKKTTKVEEPSEIKSTSVNEYSISHSDILIEALKKVKDLTISNDLLFSIERVCQKVNTEESVKTEENLKTEEKVKTEESLKVDESQESKIKKVVKKVIKIVKKKKEETTGDVTHSRNQSIDFNNQTNVKNSTSAESSKNISQKLVNLEISNFFVECSGTIKPKHKISTTTSLYINKDHEKTSSKDLLEVSNNLLFSIEKIPEPKESNSSIKPIKKVVKIIKKKTTINDESTTNSLQITNSSIECLAESKKLAEYQITNNINDLTISKEEKVPTEGSEPAVTKTKKVIKIIKKKKTDVADLVSQLTESSVSTTNFLAMSRWSGAITESKGQDFSINRNKDSNRNYEITTDINSFTVSKPEIVKTEPSDDGVKKVKKIIKIVKKKTTINSKTEEELQEMAGKLNLDIYNKNKFDIYTNNFELLSQKTHLNNLISSNVVDITVEGIKSDSQTLKKISKTFMKEQEEIQTRPPLVRKDSFGKEIVKGHKQHRINYHKSLTDIVNVESYKEFNRVEESLGLTEDRDDKELKIEEAVSFTIATQQVQKAKKTKIVKVIKKKTTLNEDAAVEESKEDLDTSIVKVPTDENKDEPKKQNMTENYNKSTRDYSIYNSEVYIGKLERKPFIIQTNIDNTFTVTERNFAKHNTICYNSLYISKREREAYLIQRNTVNIEVLKTKATDSNKFMRKIIINKQVKKDKSYTNSEDVSEQSEEELSLKTNNKTLNIVNSERLHTIEEQITPKKENKIIIDKETITTIETNETNTHEGKERTSGLVKRPTMNNTKVVTTIKKKQEKEEESEEEEKEEEEEVLTVIKPNIKQVNKVLSSASNDNRSVHSGRNVIKIQRTIVQDDKSESDTETQLKTIVKSKTVVNKTLFARKNVKESESEEEESEEEDAKPIQIKPKYKNISNKGSHSDVQSRKSITEINTHIKINLILQKMETRRRTRLIKKYFIRWKKPKLGIPSFIDSLKKSNKNISQRFDKTGSLNTSSIMLNLNRSISEEKGFSLNRSLSFKGMDIEASMLNRIVMIFKRQVKGLIYKSFMRWMCQSGVIKMRFNSRPPAKKIKIVKYQFKDGSIKTYPIEVNIANFMWKYTKPLHYYFLRLKQISRKIKEKELQKDADSWTTDYKDIK
jgi:hypothetical protein